METSFHAIPGTVFLVDLFPHAWFLAFLFFLRAPILSPKASLPALAVPCTLPATPTRSTSACLSPGTLCLLCLIL